VGNARARIQTWQGADFPPEVKLLGQRFQGGQTTERGLLLGADKFESNPRRAFGDGRHALLTCWSAQSSKTHPQVHFLSQWLRFGGFNEVLTAVPTK
jgi:hypothetical protein